MVEFEPKITTSACDIGRVKIGDRSDNKNAVVIHLGILRKGNVARYQIFDYCWSQTPENCKICVAKGHSKKWKCEVSPISLED